MKGYEIKFQVYADNADEAEAARLAIVNFINEHAREGRAVTGRKVADAVSGWKNNPIVRNRIINYFK
jgi:hypothetical protein